MLRHGLRISIAILTFTIGISLVWALGLIPRLEAALVDRFFAVDDGAMAALSPDFVDPTEEANRIYGLLVNEKFKFEDTRLIVLNPVTTGCSMYENEALAAQFGRSLSFHGWLKETMPEAESQTLDDYLARNKTSEPLVVSNLDINYAMFSASDLSRDEVYFWVRFYQKYPHSSGLVFFSNIGFNAQHTQAFVYGGYMCDGLCGQGRYFLLEKVNGKWQIIQEQGLWVS